MELCWAAVRATCRKQQHPNFEWRGDGQDRYILFCSPKLPCLNNFIPDCKPSFWTPTKNEWNAQNTIFFSTYPSANFLLLISLWLGSPDFVSLLVSSGLPCQLTVRICIPLLYNILAKEKWTKLYLITFFCTLYHLLSDHTSFDLLLHDSDNSTRPGCSKAFKTWIVLSTR